MLGSKREPVLQTQEKCGAYSSAISAGIGITGGIESRGTRQRYFRRSLALPAKEEIQALKVWTIVDELGRIPEQE